MSNCHSRRRRSVVNFVSTNTHCSSVSASLGEGLSLKMDSHFEFPYSYSELDRLTRGDFEFDELLFEPSFIDAQEAQDEAAAAVVKIKQEEEEEESTQQIENNPEPSSNYRYFTSLESARSFCEQNRDEFYDAARAAREKRKQAIAAKQAKKKKKKNLKKIFPFRLHELASSENFEPLNWAGDGTLLSVDLHKISHHLQEICSSQNYSSFLRQLHLYGFRKVGRCSPNSRHETKVAYYQHSLFQEDNPELLNHIERIK